MKKIVGKLFRCKKCGTPRKDPQKPCPCCHEVTPCVQSEVTKMTR